MKKSLFLLKNSKVIRKKKNKKKFLTLENEDKILFPKKGSINSINQNNSYENFKIKHYHSMKKKSSGMFDINHKIYHRKFSHVSEMRNNNNDKLNNNNQNNKKIEKVLV